MIRLLLILAMLFGGVAVPAFASSQVAMPVIAIEASEFHCASGEVDDQSSQSPADVAGGHHHHCGHGIAVSDIAIAQSASMLAVAQWPMHVATLGSYSQAPPTEPPSA